MFNYRAVTDPRDGRRVALKKLPNVFQSLVSSKRVFRELKMLCFFKHENVSWRLVCILCIIRGNASRLKQWYFCACRRHLWKLNVLPRSDLHLPWAQFKLFYLYFCTYEITNACIKAYRSHVQRNSFPSHYKKK